MSKLIPIIEAGECTGYMYYCPGCDSYHAPFIKPHKAPNGASWTFNDNQLAPTFEPSILTKVTRSDGMVKVCHHYVRDGKIIYLADCTHSLAGKSVEMRDA